MTRTAQIQRAELLYAMRQVDSDSELILSGAGIEIRREVLRDLDDAEAVVKAAKQYREYTGGVGLPYLDRIIAGQGPEPLTGYL